MPLEQPLWEGVAAGRRQARRPIVTRKPNCAAGWRHVG